MILARELAARWRGPAITVAVIFGLLLLGLVAYRSMDLAVYDSLPPALRALMGVPVGASPEVLSFNEMLAVLGALAVAGVAVTIGADTVAGEERRRTLGLLLAQPVSRTRAVAEKVLALLLVVSLASVGLWLAAVASAAIVGSETGDAHLAAVSAALGANAALHGALAFAVGALTGSAALAAGVGGGVLALGWLLAGLLPMWEEYADAADVVPYHWFTAQHALVDGLDPGWFALQLGVTLVLLTAGVLTFRRRDLRPARRRWLVSLARRLPTLPSAAPTGLLGWSLGRVPVLLAVVAATMFLLMGLAMGPVYTAMQPELAAMSASLPAELMVLVGAGDMSTPEGFFQAETLGMVAPAAVLVVAAALAAGLCAEERDGRLAPVLATGVPRTRVLAATWAAMALGVLVVAATTGLGIQAASWASSLAMDPAHVAGAAVHLAALGLAVGSLGFLAGAWTGRKAAVIWVVVGVGLVGHFGAAALSLSEATAGWARLSPFHWYTASMPIEHGVEWGHVAVLLTVAALATAAAFPGFLRRDLRA